MRLTLSLFLMMLPLAGQEPPKKAGPPAPKNLKILTPDDLRSGVMRQFTQALGVNCFHCHVQGDMASDENPKKNTARMMIAMVRDINSKFPDAASKTYVTCYTCHGGKVTPLTAPPAAQ